MLAGLPAGPEGDWLALTIGLAAGVAIGAAVACLPCWRGLRHRVCQPFLRFLGVRPATPPRPRGPVLDDGPGALDEQWLEVLEGTTRAARASSPECVIPVEKEGRCDSAAVGGGVPPGEPPAPVAARAARCATTEASCSLGSQHERGFHEGSPLEAAQALINAGRGDAAEMQMAYASICELAEQSPDDTGVKVRAAEAAVAVMRIGGNGNSFKCTFGHRRVPAVEKQDTPEVRKLWSEWAPRALDMLSIVEQRLGSDAFQADPFIFSLKLEAIMYASSSRGIAAGILNGHAVRFLQCLSRFERLHPDYDSGIACDYWGGYYLAAPWPVHSVSKAREYWGRGIAAFPQGKRNHYLAGVGAFMQGDFDAARAAMQRSFQAEPRSPTEQDVSAFFTEQARLAVAMLSG